MQRERRIWLTEELLVTVLLTRDEDDPAIYDVSVPGLPGSFSTLGSPDAAVRIAQGALERALEAMGDAERRALIEAQASVQPGQLPPGSRLERVRVRYDPSPSLLAAG
jgi:predicted RNase H-like HicB family nuclease